LQDQSPLARAYQNIVQQSADILDTLFENNMTSRSTKDTSHDNSNEFIADYNTPHPSSSSSKSIGVPFVHTYAPSIRQSLSLM
jgi:hypothetical protein